ncbi:hypothetical protein AVEN_2085-1 [Araneus ventricosus]|uniref:Uncharacterized protein n=1 Tax=Araneus ventricosus TaxID=182803 RepID=A0A4Y2IFI6_ARAVE|nr:hypothetical protein AVEN_2085-1 [Araneus ventricosus]
MDDGGHQEKTLRDGISLLSKTRKGKIALSEDNCTAPALLMAKSIRTRFLASKQQSCVQPLDQGIIQTSRLPIKSFFLPRHDLLLTERTVQMSVLNAIFYVDQSLDMVSQRKLLQIASDMLDFWFSRVTKELLESEQ